MQNLFIGKFTQKDWHRSVKSIKGFIEWDGTLGSMRGFNIESHRSKTIGIYEKIATVCHTNLSEKLLVD